MCDFGLRIGDFGLNAALSRMVALAHGIFNPKSPVQNPNAIRTMCDFGLRIGDFGLMRHCRAWLAPCYWDFQSKIPSRKSKMRSVVLAEQEDVRQHRNGVDQRHQRHLAQRVVRGRREHFHREAQPDQRLEIERDRCIGVGTGGLFSDSDRFDGFGQGALLGVTGFGFEGFDSGSASAEPLARASSDSRCSRRWDRPGPTRFAQRVSAQRPPARGAGSARAESSADKMSAEESAWAPPVSGLAGAAFAAGDFGAAGDGFGVAGGSGTPGLFGASSICDAAADVPEGAFAAGASARGRGLLDFGFRQKTIDLISRQLREEIVRTSCRAGGISVGSGRSTVAWPISNPFGAHERPHPGALHSGLIGTN